jgi:hypothetical protein
MVIVTMIVAIAIVRSSGFAGRHCENMCSGGEYSYSCPLLTRSNRGLRIYRFKIWLEEGVEVANREDWWMRNISDVDEDKRMLDPANRSSGAPTLQSFLINATRHSAVLETSNIR